MMKFLLVLSVTIATSFGSSVHDFRGGDIALPKTQKEAEHLHWVAVDRDDDYQITWYEKGSDSKISIGYDLKGNCAGVKTTWFESEIDVDFLSFLRSKKNQGFFEPCIVNGQKAFKSLILFTDAGVLKNGGSEKLDTDDLASSVYLKQGNSFKRISREGCAQADGKFFEQSCQSGYGLALASFGAKSKCNNVLPFYAVYDPKGEGHLIGFGWLISTKTPKKGLCLKSLSTEDIEALFPKGPSCLTSFPGLTAVEFWLSYADSLKTSCPDGNWGEKHCQHKVSSRPTKEKKKKDNSDDSSSSSDSDDSNSSGSSENKKSFWRKFLDHFQSH